MTATTQEMSNAPAKPKREIKPLNGVDTPTLFATINAVKEQPVAAQFRFAASNRWVRGTHSKSRMEQFSGAGGVHTHKRTVEYDSDHPAVLCGADEGPTPVEFLLSALAGCLTAGIANIAAARGVELRSVQSTVEGDIDLQGLLGINDEVRNGYQGIRARFEIDGDASAEKLRQIVEQSRARSAVFDVLTNGVPVELEVVAG